jgi:hypothetical protein
MMSDPTPERVREIAEWFDPIYAGRNPICNGAGDSHGITEGEVAALARQVIALREFAEDAVTKMEQIAEEWRPNPRADARVLRARLGALGAK